MASAPSKSTYIYNTYIQTKQYKHICKYICENLLWFLVYHTVRVNMLGYLGVFTCLLIAFPCLKMWSGGKVNAATAATLAVNTVSQAWCGGRGNSSNNCRALCMPHFLGAFTVFTDISRSTTLWADRLFGYHVVCWFVYSPVVVLVISVTNGLVLCTFLVVFYC